jgi:WD40 repeat protein
VKLWNVAAGAAPLLEATLELPGATAIDSLAFSPDARSLAAGQLGSASVWNVADTGHPDYEYDYVDQSSAPIIALAFSPDGATLAMADSTGLIFEGSKTTDEASEIVQETEPQGAITSMSLSFGAGDHLSAAETESGKLGANLWQVTD